MSINLPDDVWLYIARFIPHELLRNLYSVNRTFFDLAMNERYQHIGIYSPNRETVSQLDHLRNAALAQRVRSLSVQLSTIQDWMQMEIRQRRWSYRFRTVLHCLRNLEMPMGSGYYRSTDQLIRVMNKAIPNMSQVTHFTVHWEKDVSPPLLASFRSLLGSNLRRLTLRVRVPSNSLAELLCEIRMSNLENLELTLHDMQYDNVNADTPFHLVLDDISPFIRSVSPTLQSFSFSAPFHTDVSQFFSNVGRIPHLRQLTLCLPLDEAHIPDLSAFTCFLNNHSDTLRDLSLSPIYCCFRERCFNPVNSRTWSRPCLSGVTLRQLDSLTICASLMSGETSILGGLASLGGVTQALTSLSIWHHDCTLRDVEALVRHPVAPRLTSLTISIRHLSPEIMDILAATLPQLRRLDLSIRGVIAYEGGVQPIFRLNAFRRILQDTRQVELFFVEMRKRSYPSWGLVHFGIIGNWHSRHVDVISACIPSLVRLCYLTL